MTTGQARPAESGRLAAWLKSWEAYRDRRVLAVLLLGFASGLPILLVGSTLSAWLREAEVSRSGIGLFAYVFAPYTLKFAWAPLMDRLALPPFTSWLGRRRGWMLATQIGLLLAILGLAQTSPATGLAATAIMALLVAFFSASQDIVIDAYRVEILPEEKLGAGAGVVVLGYRVGMWVAGAGTLFAAEAAGWTMAYSMVAGFVLVGMATVLLIEEPAASRDALPSGLQRPKEWLRDAVIEPFADFFARHGVRVALVILAFISLYKASDVLLMLMTNPFYLDIGFSKGDIAEVSGTFGIFATIAGGLAGGMLVFRMGILPSLLVAGVLQAASNLMFAALAVIGPSKGFFYLTVMVENLTGGMGTSAFVAYLSSLCNLHYTAVQYALLTSFMQMLGKYVIVPMSGFYADWLGTWELFFVTSTLFSLPGLLLVLYLQRRLRIERAPAPPLGQRVAG
ncbi:AmpG family muropeptide MFS transporter [Geminicoccaceae bacterium 1502E]|nr:AmpG family muropeptide MFS transporter [Geminicoccaceae bacterium 1502E]